MLLKSELQYIVMPTVTKGSVAVIIVLVTNRRRQMPMNTVKLMNLIEKLRHYTICGVQN